MRTMRALSADSGLSVAGALVMLMSNDR